ncbi:endonuclease MutS2 [Metabacillus fastidiosus]|uniref:endonuclease MutS2 n=1 Tax=Metabacillus fastidiosus TaxID=1458 RepID=UPI000824F9A5|nr:endonuclease MutS2 [Metabacillus fastidiosus]MED4464075.1 endonuclease MutS2 [Metabacillus fastidiosus]
MQGRVLKVLEFEKVKEQLIKHASSSLGKEKVRTLIPAVEFETVQVLQEQTDEALKILRLRGNAPLGGLVDVKESVKRSKIGGMLGSNELVEIAGTLYASRNMKRFIEDMVEGDIELTHFPLLAEEIIILHDLEKKITQCIDDNGRVLDHASDALRTIRQQLRTTESRVREKLESMIRSSSATKMLSDAIITIRNDRFVLPVKQEYRSAYGGIVHDQSSSGATLFIEPQVIVDLNNTLQQVRAKEKAEIERILKMLSEEVAIYSEEVLANLSILAEMDFMFAKARYAKEINGTKPLINNERVIRIFKGRHPLLPVDKVVANDIELGIDFTTILITGPNTGGKTVALKTLGLFTLMAQSGLQIPALEGSEMAVFTAVHADIGDEQSIEQSLSTFSSHMVNIVDILNRIDANSLVLFDELGAGTDPQEGAALAISILDEVYNRGARVVATTHYPELKAYGYNREGVINASVEFDIKTLSPTYKLLIGVPGRSNAFEISKRLGLNERVINNARSLMSADSNEVDSMIASLEQSQKRAEREREEAESIRKEAESLHHELQNQIIEFNSMRDKMYEDAEKTAADKVEEAKKEAEEIIRDLRKMRIEQRANIKEHELIEARKKLEGAVPAFEKSKKAVKKEQKKQEFLPGDEVKVLTFDQKGHLIEKTSDKEWQVQIGIMKMKVKEKDLEYVSRPKQVEQKKALTAVKGRDYHVSLELDLRGERYENALLRVEKYLDDAVLAGYPRVSIIHGKGTGALRQGVTELLKNHRSVKNTRFGEASEGGSGVTVVELK